MGKISCLLLCLSIGTFQFYVIDAFMFQGSSSENQKVVDNPPDSNGRPWGLPHRRAIVLPCDGSIQITMACDTFCKSIKAASGSCVPREQTCGCIGIAPGPVPGPVTSGSSQSMGPGNGIHTLTAPDLSQVQNKTSSTSVRITSETSSGRATQSMTSKRRRRRQTSEKVIQGSGSKNSGNSCTVKTCQDKCVVQGYGSCAAECIGLSCYCRCPEIDKPNENPSATPDPLLAKQQYQPEDVEMSNAFRPPPSGGVGDFHF